MANTHSGKGSLASELKNRAELPDFLLEMSRNFLNRENGRALFSAWFGSFYGPFRSSVGRNLVAVRPSFMIIWGQSGDFFSGKIFLRNTYKANLAILCLCVRAFSLLSNYS